MNNDLHAESQRVIAAYKSELSRRPSRPDRSWRALERRIASGEAPPFADDVEIDDFDIDERAHRHWKWRWLTLPLAAASMALLAFGLRDNLTESKTEGRHLHAAAFETVRRTATPAAVIESDATEDPASVAWPAARMGRPAFLRPPEGDAHHEETTTPTPSGNPHLLGLYDVRNAAVRKDSVDVRTSRQSHRRRVPPTVTATATATSESREASTIAQEAALLAQGREALRDGRPLDALRFVAQHAKLFPEGTLSQERSMLKVAARCARGDHETARRDAQDFVRRFPNSPLRARVLALCPASPRRGD